MRLRTGMLRCAVVVSEALEGRAIVAEVGGRWVAHPTNASDAARLAAIVHDATPSRATVELLSAPEVARSRMLLAGCAPALGVLADRLNESMGPGSFRWLPRSSDVALDALAADRVHVGGTHFVDARTGAPDLVAVRRRAVGRELAVVTLAHWEVGLVVAAGNPRGVRDIGALARRGTRIALREVGSGARRMLESELRRAGLPTALLGEHAVLTLHGHLEVAQAVALGVANVGPSTHDAARSYGLDFVPLARERFDVVVPREGLTEPRVARMMDTLASARWRRELEALGYEASESGQVAATVRAA